MTRHLQSESGQKTQVVRRIVPGGQTIVADVPFSRHIQGPGARETSAAVPHIVDHVTLFSASPFPCRVGRLIVS